ncbi:MAG: AMP-binding protein [Candidatus Latescibacteria bacterium]|nr:AMP-binding protein [Candidatus Latescibacterota bacterium]NIM21504.1 AMP-binding protein [Candidatus Latescibacterota bacterium]NIM65675.1 AMP-binding protein [Candidatus Latescibacterota bacterium]NIO02057.1 AMP-binding protein [Candidatus Latescibacterota bacterium]NIO28869.1 AMP-binding protein [Candidatus Latescibacterota bacterium]
MLVQKFLERSAEKSPAKEALVAGNSRITYSELDSAANRLASALWQSGIEYSDRVAVLLDNGIEAVISIWGILKAGATFLVINPTTKTQKITYILNNCRAAGLITHYNKLKNAKEAIDNTPSLKTVFMVGKRAMRNTLETGSSLKVRQWTETLDRRQESNTDNKAIDIDLAALIYTSGTTGNPKGVMMTHQNIVSASTSITTYLENVEDDIVLSVLPLSFDYGLYQVIMAAQFGGTVILERSFTYPYAVINLLKKEKVTGFPIVPTISAILLQMKELKSESFEHMRYISNTAAALPEKHILGLKEIFPGARIYSMYGLTECKRVSYMPPEELDRKPTSVGKGMPNEQVYLVDEEGRVISEPGVIGELVVRGGNVMKGYWELPEETAEMLKPGRYPWEQVLFTGDLFKMDEEGYLYFVSRKDDIIKSRGEKVSPKEVESVLYALDDVVEAAVIGVPDDVLGEAIKAYVVLKDGSDLAVKEIMAYCNKNLEDFMVPKYVELSDSLPKTSSGKITKKDLKIE